MLRLAGMLVLPLALVACLSISVSTPTVEPSPIVTPTGRNPYLDGMPPRSRWHYPLPPEGLTARPLDGNSVMLEWESVRRAAGYDVLHYPYAEGVVLTPENVGDESLGTSEYAYIGDLFTAQTSHRISDLECEQTYLFEVRALGDGGLYGWSEYPIREDYGEPSRVIVSPCDAEPALSAPYTGLCPEEGMDCLLSPERVSLSSGWPPFQAVYSTVRHKSWTHDCRDGQYYDSRSQIKHMDYRGDYNHRTTVLADYEWAYPGIECSGSGSVQLEGIGSYEELKGLIHTTYNASEDSGRIERTRSLSLFPSDLTEHLGYYERIFGTDHPATLMLMGIRPEDGAERPRGILEDYDGVCYRNVCESENAAIRYGDELVTNDAYNIPLLLGASSGRAPSLRVHQLWIDADRTP